MTALTHNPMLPRRWTWICVLTAILLPIGVVWLPRLPWKNESRTPEANFEHCVRMALTAQVLGDKQRALHELRRAERIAPETPEAYATLSALLQRMGNSELAWNYAERSLRLTPIAESTEQSWVELLSSYYRLGKIAEARRILGDDLLPHWPHSIDGHFWQAKLALLEAGVPAAQSAVSHLERLLELDPTHIRGRFEYGVGLARLGRLDEARQALEQVISAEPQWTAPHHALASVLQRMGDDESAQSELATFLEIEEKSRRRVFLTTQNAIGRASADDVHELARLHLEFDEPKRALAALQKLDEEQIRAPGTAELLAMAESHPHAERPTGHGKTAFESDDSPTLIHAMHEKSSSDSSNPLDDYPKETARSSLAGFEFTDVTAASGLDFCHRHGGNGQHLYIETMGPGCAFLDYDLDGWLDILLIQGGNLSGSATNANSSHRLYRNCGDGEFQDVTLFAGLGFEHYGLGCCCADYDNDGDTDICITGLQENLLLGNNGDGTFTRITSDALSSVTSMTTSPSFVDVDHDGNLDLFICRYTDYDLGDNPACTTADGEPAYCAPQVYTGTGSVLLFNDGQGSWTDASVTSGITSAPARAMGMAAADFDEDGLIDLYVTSDLIPNRLFVQQQSSQRLLESGPMLGAAYGQDGAVLSGMGVDCGDYDNDGHLDLVVTNFASEPNTLYHNEGVGLFVESSRAAGLAKNSLPFVSWGIQFADFNLDGWQDLFVVSGHVDDHAGPSDLGGGHAQPAQIFRNCQGTFVDVSASSGNFFDQRQVGRGAAFGDIDNDGHVDVLIACNNQPAKLLRNATRTTANTISMRLVGRQSNRDAIGCRVQVSSDGQPTQTRVLCSGTSYLSDHDRRLQFGIGAASKATVTIHWPSGHMQREGVNANTSQVFIEDRI